MRHSGFLILLVVLVFSSCRYFGGERVFGDGNITSKQLSIGSFNAVDVSGAIKLHVKQDANNGVRVEVDQNLHEFIDIYTDGDVLVVHSKQGYNLKPSGDIILFVSAPYYRQIEVSGACNIIGEGVLSGSQELTVKASGASSVDLALDLPAFTSDLSGSSDIALRGKVGKLRIEGSGASNIKAFDLVSEDAELDLSGSSDANLSANRSLKVEASGASTINYKGNAVVTQQVSGAGSVKRVD
jgi:hypothetical protein